MEIQIINFVYIYSMCNKHKVIGKLENVSIYESLKKIRPKIKKMTKNDEFIKPINDYFDIFDKDMEEEFCLRDILIKENGVYKIYIKESNNTKIIKCNNNNNFFNYENIINQTKCNIPVSHDITINNMNNININDMNKINNMNNMNNMNNNMLNMNNIKLQNFIKINNNTKNINNINNMCNINNFNNMNNINHINNNNNMNYNNNGINNNSKNKIIIKFNDQMNDNFAKVYHVHFKTNNNIDYIITAYGRKRMYGSCGDMNLINNVINTGLINRFEEKMGKSFYISVYDFSYLYNGIYIIENETMSDYFKNDKNPIITVIDKNNKIGKLILVTFKINNGDKYEIIFNSKSNISLLRQNFLREIGYNIYLGFDFLYKGQKIIKEPESFNFINELNNTTIGELFKNENNPIIIVNDKNNVIGKKIKINFETNHGYKHEIIIHNKKTIIELLLSYLGEIDERFTFDKEDKNLWHSEKDLFEFIDPMNMINMKNMLMIPIAYNIYIYNQIIFIYKGQQIIYNRTTIGDYFKNDYSPKIFVKDLYNLFFINWGRNMNVNFKNNHGYRNQLIINNTEDCYQMIAKYFILIGYEKLFEKYKIQFIYNNKQIKYDPFNGKDNDHYITIGQLFQNESNPTIFVNDIYNLLLIDWNQTKQLTFKVNQKFKKEFIIKNTDYIDQALNHFFYEIDQKELENNNEIKYFYNSKQINFISKVTVGELFLNDYNPVVFVMDINNLVETPIDITFKTSLEYIVKITINPKKTAGYLLMYYLDKINHSELIDRNDKIVFLYNAQKINFEDKTILKNLFFNNNSPTILVIDVNNVLSNGMISKMNVFFQANKGRRYNIVVNYGTTLEQLIKKFLYKNCSNELIDSYYSKKNPRNITFSYNGNLIKFGEKSYVEQVLQECTIIQFNYD